MGIFKDTAPAYYKHGLSVIPLIKNQKRPIPPGWQMYHDVSPSVEMQNFWLHNHADANIGLVLGAQSNLCALDIDTDDPAIIKVILDVLKSFESPWVRIGRKGMVLAYKFGGQPTFRIRRAGEKGSLVELLSSRTQVVLPPSIHPDTMQPYSANVDLLDVLREVPPLPRDFEAILRSALEESGVELSHSGWTRVTDYVSVGARDVQMTQVAGLFASGVTRGELSVKEAVERMRAWHSSCVDHVAGDDVDVDKGIRNVIQFLARDVLERGRPLPAGWDDLMTPEEKSDLGINFTNEHEEWTIEAMTNYLREQFEKYPAESTGRGNAIAYILDRIAHSPNIGKLDEERLLKWIADSSLMKLGVPALKAELRRLRQGDVKGTDQTELANATIRDLSQFGEISYYNGRFMQWCGSHWSELEEQKILRHIAQEYGSLETAKRSADHKGILAVMRVLVPQSIQTISRDGVNFANGFLTTDLELLPHDPKFGMTYTMPYRYLPGDSGKAWKFEQLLHDCWGHKPDFQDRKSALQEMICATIFKMSSRLQRAFLLYGVAKTGKSAILDIVRGLIPDEARSAVDPTEWSDKFAPTQMTNSLLNVCGEISEKKKIDGNKFKQIIDGEEMTGQYKGQQLFKFRPNCAQWFASNHLPRTDDTSVGFTRRWLILDFDKVVSKEKRILSYGNLVVAEEREAIIAWAIESLGRLLKASEFTIPACHVELISEVASLNSSVRFFMMESGMIALRNSASVPTSEMKLHDAYLSFCLGAGGVRPVSMKIFRQQMKQLENELGFKIAITTIESGTPACVYEGITLVGSKAA